MILYNCTTTSQYRIPSPIDVLYWLLRIGSRDEFNVAVTAAHAGYTCVAATNYMAMGRAKDSNLPPLLERGYKLLLPISRETFGITASSP